MVGFALLGAGIFATQEHLPAIEAASQLELKAIYSRSQETAEALHAKAQGAAAIDVYFDKPAVPGRGLADLLARSDIAGVAVCLPIAVQPQVVRQALTAGKHVISEKPVAPTAAVARDLLAFYQGLPAAGRPLWAVAENYRFQPGLQAAVAQARALGGTLVSFQVQAAQLVSPDGGYFNTSWRKVPTHPGGFLLDGGVHYVAALRTLLAAAASSAGGSAADTRITKLASFSTQLQPHLPPVDTLRAVGITAGGVSGLLNVTFGTEFDGPELEIAVVTTEGRIAWTLNDLKVLRRGAAETQTVDFSDVAAFGPANESNGVKHEFAAFAKSIASGDAAVDSRQSSEEALQDLLVLETMLKSGEEGGVLRDVV